MVLILQLVARPFGQVVIALFILGFKFISSFTLKLVPRLYIINLGRTMNPHGSKAAFLGQRISQKLYTHWILVKMILTMVFNTQQRNKLKDPFLISSASSQMQCRF